MRIDKNNYLDELATTAEKAAADNQQGTLYGINHTIPVRGFRTNISIKDKQGTLLTTERKQESGRTNHFKKALNKDKPDAPVNTHGATADLNIDANPPSNRRSSRLLKS